MAIGIVAVQIVYENNQRKHHGSIAEHMLALRIHRLNGDWQAYWAALAANPPVTTNLNRPKVSPNAAA
jgi:hypothetical protein